MDLRSFLSRRSSQASGPADGTTTPGHGEFEAVAEFYDRLMHAVPYSQWVDYLEAILRRCECRPARTLDLCCGTGKVGSCLAARGYPAVGIDLSAPMGALCKSQRPPLPAAVQDASCLGLQGGAFDLVVSLFDSLNYILQPQALAAALGEAYRVLRDGGLLVFDLNTQRALSAGLFNQSNLDSGAPLLYSWKATWEAKTRICRVDMWFNWRADGQDLVFEETHYQYAYDNEQMLGMLQEAGFCRIRAYHAYTFRPPTPWSDRVFCVAVKGQ